MTRLAVAASVFVSACAGPTASVETAKVRDAAADSGWVTSDIWTDVADDMPSEDAPDQQPSEEFEGGSDGVAIPDTAQGEASVGDASCAPPAPPAAASCPQMATALPCDYSQGSFIGNPYVTVFQFERYSTASEPPVPGATACLPEFTVLIRVRWFNCWADNGCGPDGSPSCGGHCQTSKALTYLLDPQTTLVLSVHAEDIAAWKNIPPPQLVSAKGGAANEFEVVLPELSLALRTTDIAAFVPETGLDGSIPHLIRRIDSATGAILGAIDLPLPAP